MGRSTSIAGALAACWLSCLGAQPPPLNDPAALLQADEAQRAIWAADWLNSGDPLRVAWGAWLVRVDRRTTLVPRLIQDVAAYRSPGGDFISEEGNAGHDAMLAVLDALIELHAPLPAEEARRLYPEFAAQSVILLVRSPDDPQKGLLDIFDQAKANWTWLAAGNVLLRKHAAGFAARLLDRFTQRLTFYVVDPNGGFGAGSGGGGSECGFSLRGPKTGWPSVGLYQLTQFPERLGGIDATLVADGPAPVYYWREETGNYDNPPDAQHSCDGGDRDRYRAQYLAKLLESSSPQISLDAYASASLLWRNEAGFRQQVLAAVEEARNRFRSAVARLQDFPKMLTPEEAETLKPRIEIVLHDERSDQSIPLPALMDIDGNALVRTSFSKPLD